MRVLVTRPHDQADGLIGHLQRLGFEVIAIPMLATRQKVHAASHQLICALASRKQHADYAVFISSNAVRFTAQYLAEQGLEWPAQLPCIPIGDATKQAVFTNGWPLHDADIGAQRSSEKMLEALLTTLPDARTAIIVSGADGRSNLEKGLKQAGVKVLCIETYERFRPSYDSKKLAARFTDFLTANENANHMQAMHHTESLIGHKALLFASGETLCNFVYYVAKTQAPQLLHLPCVVPSPRVAKIAAENGFTNVIVAVGASAEAFAAALQSLAKSG